MLKHSAVILALILAILPACKKDKLDQHSPGSLRGYFPMELKKSRYYLVDSIYHNAFTGKNDSFHYEIKETLDTFFLDNMQDTAARIIISHRANDSSVWTPYKAMYIKCNSLYAERVEENIRYIKLSYPLNFEKIWNSNALNTLKENILFYTGINTSVNIGTINYDSSLIVEAEPIHNPFEDFEYKEIYGKNYGLLYLRRSNLFLQQNKKSGIEITYTLYDYR